MSPSTNITFGLIWICVGLAVGAPMARAFFDPGWLGGYGSLERRLLRLAHVAFVALGMLNVVLGVALQCRAISAPAEALACTALASGALSMPLFLLASMRFRAVLWALPIPFLLVFGGTIGITLGRFMS
jgi:hypothetical protein